MLRILSALSLVMTIAAWVALFVGARIALIALIATTGPVIAVWSLFYMAEYRRLERGEPSLLGAAQASLLAGGKRRVAIPVLGAIVGVLGPVVGITTGVWFQRLSESTIFWLWLALLTPLSLLVCLQSLGTSQRLAAAPLTDEMLEQIRGRAAFRTLVFENVLLVACIVGTGIAKCPREVTYTVFYGLLLAGVVHFVVSYQRECRRMVA